MSLLDKASLVQIPSGYKATKLYSVVPESGVGDLSFTRASTATRVNDSGLIETVAIDTPRIDYTLSGCGKLILEPQRTNLAIRSQEFDNSIWTTNSSFATVTADATTSKWGTANADKIVATTGSTAHYIRQTNITVVADKYTFSVLAKKAEWNTIELRGTNFWASTPQGVFNLNTGVVFSTANATATIEDWGDGWYLCTVTATTNAIAGSNAKFQISIGNNNSLFVSGDNTSGLYVSDA